MEELISALESAPVGKALFVTFLTLGRVGPFVFLVPALGGPTISATARGAVAAGLTVLMWPQVWAQSPNLPVGSPMAYLLVSKEILVGVTMGLLVALVFQAFDAAGRAVDSLRGSQMAQTSSPLSQDPSSPLATFLLLLAVAVFVSAGGHHILLRALGRSYEILPAPALGPGRPGPVLATVIHVGAEYFAVAVGIAAPILVTAFLVDLAAGLVGRAAPGLPSYFMALPLRAWLAVLTLFLVLPVLVRLLLKLSELMAWSVLEIAQRIAG